MKHRWRWHKPLKSPARGMEAGARERLAGRPAEGRRHGRAVWLAEAGGAGRGGRPGRLVAPREGERPGLRRPGSRRGEAAPTGCWSTRDRGTAGVLVDPGGRAAAAGPRGPRGQLVDRIHQEGRREGGARARARARALRPRGPLWEGGSARPPPATSKRLSGRGPPALPPFPVPARGERPGGEGGGQRAGRPDAPGAERRGERTPPTLRLAGKRARERKDGATDADGMGWDGKAAASPQPPCPAPPRPAPPGPRLPPRQGRRDAGGTEGGRGQDRTGPDRTGQTLVSRADFQ